LIGDTTGDRADGHLGPLPGARNEVHAIAREFGGAVSGNVTLLLGKDATYQRVLQELASGDYDVVHFAGHAWYDMSGTYLIVNDGVVRASELMTLLIRHPPVLLFINSHFTGFVPAFTQAFPLPLPDGSSFDDFYRLMRRRRPGLEHAVARAGVGTFVGCMGEPSDDGAAAFAISFYAQLRRGAFVAEALRRAREGANVGQDATPMLYAAAGYLDLRLAGTR
jgi:CHAT domain-containing protein